MTIKKQGQLVPLSYLFLIKFSVFASGVFCPDLIDDPAIRQAVETGEIEKTRYESYLRLYEKASQIKLWELK